MLLDRRTTTPGAISNCTAVVIPYYQREAGILTRTIESVLAQDHTIDLRVLVVDDGSPVPARSELEKVASPRRSCVSIFDQTNAGAAAARNRGLDQVPAECEYVAFIDSDDTWEPDHLTNALAALNDGYDLYFSDWLPLAGTRTSFASHSLDPQGHPPLGCGSGIHRYSGNLADRIVRGGVIGTSTVVYRYRSWPHLRFLRAYQRAGEDQIFWMMLTERTDAIAFSERCEMSCGRGVNIWWGSVAPGSDGRIRRIYDDLRFHQGIERHFRLSPGQTRDNGEEIDWCRREFADALVSQLRRGRLRHLWYFFPYAARDPRLIAAVWRKLNKTESE